MRKGKAWLGFGNSRWGRTFSGTVRDFKHLRLKVNISRVVCVCGIACVPFGGIVGIAGALQGILDFRVLILE